MHLLNRIRYFRIFHSKIRRKKFVEKNFIEKQEEKFVSPIALLYLMRRRMQCNLFFFSTFILRIPYICVDQESRAQETFR